MERYFSTNAIVLREADYGESSKMLTLFSGDYGILRVSARGVKRPKSKLRASAQLFCYSRFELYRGSGEVHTVTGASVLESFYNLGRNLEALETAGRIAGILLRALQPELPDPETLRLVLNSFYFLAEEKRSARYVQTVFLLRFLFVQGFLPDPEAFPALLNRPLQPATAQALSHIAESDMEALFQFGVSDTILDEMENIAERLEREYLG